MRTTFALTALVASLSAVAAIPRKQGEGFIGQATQGNNSACDPSTDREYIVMLQKDEHPDAIQILARMNKTLDDDDVLWSVNNEVFAAMSVMTDGCTIEGFNAMSEVAYYEEKTTIQSFVTQNQGAPWGLQRISNEAGASGSPQGQDFTYSFDDEALGAGVDIYVIDTGVRVSHAVFTGRATEGFSFTGSAADGDGHGTHVAGTAAGAKFGVAQAANIFAVKVLGDDGSGSSSDTISGMDWVINNHNKRKTQPGFVGSIMSMSWGLQGTARAVDEVITGASEAGIHVSVAAGNDGADACGSTPAHLGGANSNVVTVGSVNIQNSVSTFSNIGKCVDIYAPGEQILSAWNTGDTIINFLSGTSMACPHTTGVMAYLMAQDAAKFGQDPAALKQALLTTARQGKISGNTGGSANLLLSNGVDGGVTARRLTKDYVVPDRPGSPAARAGGVVNINNKAPVDKRWSVHSEVAELRF